MSALPSEIESKRDELFQLLAGMGKIAVAFSAGVDSTVLAKAVCLAEVDKAWAVMAESASLPQGTIAEGRELADQIGIPFVVLKTNEFSHPDYQANRGDRCFYCKDTLYETIEQHRQSVPYDVIVNGANIDDQGDYRPGMKAAAEHQVRSPLLEVGLTKSEIRQLAQHWDLPVWDKPASPCLSSRIAHHLEVTPERVQRVDAAESFLRQLTGIQELRVRHEHHDLARIEVPIQYLSQIVEPATRQLCLDEFQKLGFQYITIDLAGFRSGSMNDVLVDLSVG